MDFDVYYRQGTFSLCYRRVNVKAFSLLRVYVNLFPNNLFRENVTRSLYGRKFTQCLIILKLKRMHFETDNAKYSNYRIGVEDQRLCI